jgi:hypothetical protein
VIRGRVLVAVVLGAVVVVSAAAVALTLSARGGDGETAPAGQGVRPIEARGIFSPSNALFGDTVAATIEVTLDRRRVDPDSVSVRTDFSPWRPFTSPRSDRRDAGTTTYLRTTYVLRCLDRSCAPASEEDVVQEFVPARVSYASREAEGGSSARSTLETAWPVLVVGSRYTASAGAAPAGSSRWRMDLLSLPAVSYGVSPSVLIALLLAAAAVLAIVGGRLAYLAFPRKPAPVQEPPEPVLTPLERALLLLEDPARLNGAGDQRRALEFVALELVARGDLALAEAARALAWSEPVPGVQKTSGIAARARSALEEADA